MQNQEEKFKLKKVTPRAVQVFKKHGLLDFKKTSAEKAELSYELYSDPDKVREIAKTIFEGPFEKTNWDEFDLSILAQGIQDFLLQLAGRLPKSEK